MCNEPNGAEYVYINQVKPFFSTANLYFLFLRKTWSFVYFSWRLAFGVRVAIDSRIWHDQHNTDVIWQRFKCGLGRTMMYFNTPLKYTTTASVLWERKTKKAPKPCRRCDWSVCFHWRNTVIIMVENIHRFYITALQLLAAGKKIDDKSLKYTNRPK